MTRKMFTAIITVILALHILTGSIYAVTFQTPNPTTKLKLLGDAHIDNNDYNIILTGNYLSPTTVTGRALYDEPVIFRHPGTKNTASFSASFSLLISTIDPNSMGGGVAFIISPDRKANGNAGGYLGTEPSTEIVIEFDTFENPEFNDINGNHVGLDIGSMISLQVVNLDLFDIYLASDKVIYCWIDYSSSTKLVSVFVSYQDTRPTDPVLSITQDLSPHLKDKMFVGFSASTHGSTQSHRIPSSNFTSHFDETLPQDSQIQCHGVKWCNKIVKYITFSGGALLTIILAFLIPGPRKVILNFVCCNYTYPQSLSQLGSTLKSLSGSKLESQSGSQSHSKSYTHNHTRK